MRVLVTGATGFVGRWLIRELEACGHSVVGAPSRGELDITDMNGVAALVDRVRPDAVAHLAGVAFGPDADADPERALRVNLGGTTAIVEALRSLALTAVPLLVAGSSEIYGHARGVDLPISESAPIAPVSSYGLSKAAQEGLALEARLRYGMPVVVARSFNHTGPGQRPEFAVPALARRVLSVRRGPGKVVAVGNLDVRRDFLDVRDVVRAYRLILEALQWGLADSAVVNVASGTSVSMREIIAGLCRLAEVEPVLRVDPALVRPSEPQEIRGDPSALARMTGWMPRVGLDQTLADVLAEAAVA